MTEIDARRFLISLKSMGIESYVSQKKDTAALPLLRKQVGDCKKCSRSATRKHVVFGEGSETARLVFVGEAPGELVHECLQSSIREGLAKIDEGDLGGVLLAHLLKTCECILVF